MMLRLILNRKAVRMEGSKTLSKWSCGVDGTEISDSLTRETDNYRSRIFLGITCVDGRWLDLSECFRY